MTILMDEWRDVHLLNPVFRSLIPLNPVKYILCIHYKVSVLFYCMIRLYEKHIEYLSGEIWYIIQDDLDKPN